MNAARFLFFIFPLQSRCERVMPWLIKHVGMIDLSQLLYITEILCPLMNYWGTRVEVRYEKMWKQHHKQEPQQCYCWQINIIPTHLAPLVSTQWGRTESSKRKEIKTQQKSCCAFKDVTQLLWVRLRLSSTCGLFMAVVLESLHIEWITFYFRYKYYKGI